ncbi:hypothetical protein AHAS_Ahas19G0224700 [Arachis hypogaea]
MAYMAGQSGGSNYQLLGGQGECGRDDSRMLHTERRNRLGSLFWADGEMMSDYQVFGDVLAFDSTYRSNKYKKPLVVFSGLNRQKQTSILGFALLEDEEAIRSAIVEVMSTATHRLCGWHLEKNCVQRVKDTEFRKVFKKALYANFEIDNFEEYWKTSVESLGLLDNGWVQSTYETRES